MSFTDADLKRVRAYTKRGDIQWEDLIGLIARLEAAEEIAKGVEVVLPEDENCGGSMCDLLKAWRRAAGK